MSRLPSLLTFFLLFFLPFVILPFGTSQFEIPKVIVAQIGIEALVVSSILLGARSRLSKAAVIGFGTFAVISVVDLFFFQTKFSFFGNQFRLQGIFLFWHLLLFSIFSVKGLLQKVRVFWIFLFLFIQFAGVYFFGVNEVGRSYSFLGEPNSFATVAIFAFPLTFFAKGTLRIRLVSILLAVSLVLASGSRSGVIALGVETFFLLVSAHFPKKIRLIFLMSLGFFLLSLFAPFVGSDIHESRIEIWRAAMVSFFHHPLIGGGFGNIDLLIHEGSMTFASFISARYVDSSHNMFLDILIQSGIVGVGAFLILLRSVVSVFLKERNRFFLAIFLGVITMASFNPMSVWVLLVFWYLVGEGSVITIRPRHYKR